MFMRSFRSCPPPLLYFFIPFLLLAGLMAWTSFRISRPDQALETARGYLQEMLPGAAWEVGKIMKVGNGLDKKWRIELSASRKDGRLAQANLFIDRWRPGRLVGKFVLLLGPPQILDGGWENPFLLGLPFNKIPGIAYLIAGLICVGLQCLWLHRMRRKGKILGRDGMILALLGAGLLASQLVLEVHFVYMAAYALVMTLVVWAVFSENGVHGAV
jgi:hypothetical protein